MAHHKRRRPKHQRGGCLMCKAQKDERYPKSQRRLPRDDRRLQKDKYENEV